MRLQDDLDFTTLNWVKQELDETLKQARQSLEAFVEDPADASQMRFCATYLHQVQGTLRMVELYGASMVVEEMERVAQGLIDNQIKQKDDSYAVLMRGMMQLPDYLERLQSGHKDIPIVLLPLLNDLRSCRGEKLLSESVLFSPDLAAPLPKGAAGPDKVTPEIEHKALAARLRTNFQTGLLNWIRDRHPDEAIGGLIGTLERLRTTTTQEEGRRLWWVASGVLEALQLRGLETNATVKLLFGKVDREIKRLADNGEASFRVDPPRELVKNLLYYVAHAKSGGERVKDIKHTYRLDDLVPTEAELEQAKGTLAGKNRALLDTVSSAIKEDLLRVKDQLDLFLRNADARPEDLASQTDVLDRVADTLGMLGLGVPRRVVQDQRKALSEISAGMRKAEEGALLDIAGALLYVEASLDENIETLGGSETPTTQTAAAAAAATSEMELPQVEVKRILEAVMKEAQANLQQAKNDVVAFVESPWDHAKVTTIPKLLEEISGALKMLNLDEAVELTQALTKFIEVELLRMKRVPTSEQMDRLADALASVEYYVEATRDQRVGREKILDVTRRSLEALGYWPVPSDAELAERVQAMPAPAPETPAAAVPESLTLGFGPPTVSGRKAMQDVPEPTEAEAAQLPSIDLPGAEDIAAFAARVDRGEESPAAAEDFAKDGSHPTGVPAELRSVVEIAQGADLSDLVLGETPAHAHAPPPPAAELAGLRFAETQSGLGVDRDDDYEWIEVEEEVEVAAPAEAPADASFQSAPSDEIDDEIREVFVEEVQEEINNINRQLPEWRAQVEDYERLKPIRRSFHTLKGSGRLVGALALGEFSWKIENMLNRVLDKTIQPGDAVQAILDHAVAALPELLGALREEGAPKADIAGIMAVADKLSQGEEAFLARAEKVKVKQIRRVRVPRTRIAPAQPVELEQTFDITQPLEEAVEAAEVPLTAVAMPEISDELSLPELEPIGAFEAAGAGPAMPDIEPTLREILKSELEGHLVTITDYLDASAAAPQPLKASEALLRAVHTMHGAISMVDLPVLGEVFGPLESYVKRLRAQEEAPDRRGLMAIQEASELVGTALALLDTPGASMPRGDALVSEMMALRDGLPEPASALAAFALSMEDDDDFAPLAPVEAAEEAPAPVAELESVAMDELSIEPFADATLEPVALEPAELATELEFDAAAFADAVPTASRDADLPFDLGAVDEAPVEERAEPALEDAAADATAWDLMFAEGVPEAAEPAAPVAAEAVQSDDAWLSEARGGREEPVIEMSEEMLAALELDEPLEAGVPESVADEPAVETVEPVEDLESLDAEEEPVPLEGAGEEEEEESREPVFDALEEPIELATEAELAPLAAFEEPEPAAAAAAVPAVVLAAIAEDPDPSGPLVLADMDEDLLEIFVDEGVDILDRSDALVAQLREAPGDREAITGLQRHLHTLKGNARAVGLAGIGDLSHAMESVIERSVGEELTLDRAGVALMERGFDKLHHLVSRVAKRQAIGVPGNMIERFEALAAGESVAVEAAPAVEAIELESAAPVEAAKAAPAVEEARAPDPAPAPKPRPRPAPRVLPEPVAEEEGARPQQEMIRVRSDLLDALVNFAGEVSIYRSRLEQQMGSYRFNLVELEQTVLRLREQLRKLELETEAQIIARYQREAEAEGAEQVFDPLELDRFSNIQQLSRALAESVSDLTALQNALDDLTRQSETLLLQQSRVSSELQEGLMRTRMVPFDSVVPFLRRLVRQTADELGKRATLRIEGAQGEMDRNLLERMKAPFEHMLRNAMAHGIESPSERLAAGKPEEGSIRIQVSREATEVVIKVSDDGAGMDRDAIRRKAIERGLMRPDAQLSDRDLFAFISETGFSTAEQVTKIAGRGVGMDVVASEIKQLGGSLSIDSQRGAGSQFNIRLPFTLAVTQAIMVRLGDSVFAVPMSSVQGVARIEKGDLQKRLQHAVPTFAYAGDEYLIHELDHLLGLVLHRAADDNMLPLLLTRTGDQRAAIRVDAVLGSREIVVKSVGPQLASVPGIFGATIMGDGSVVMILDVAPLVRRAAALREEVAREAELEAALPGLIPAEMPAVALPEAMAEVRRQPLIMVVDDSITMRKVTTRVLERNDMEVVTAKDGLDAVEKLQDRVPDLVLLDIEMPRMDGYELATYMRNDSRLKTVPIIMITSRTGEKHRQRAFEIGVDRYLGKPYQEADLLRNVEETLRLSRAIH